MIQLTDLYKSTASHADEIKAAILRATDSGWYLRGKETKLFEERYAKYIGTAHCVGCGNGLDALTLILRAYMELGEIREGDEVIVPANTYIASILAVTRNRLRPVLVEPDPSTLQMDDKKIGQAITPHTRAVMIVHLYGRCAYTERVEDICRTNGLRLIEDNAQAHGCSFHGHKTGALGHAAAHSFYPTKNLGALGDAGAVTTDDSRLARMVSGLANYGSAEKYVFSHIGINSRMDELQAAVLSAKLDYLDSENRQRRTNALHYIRNVDNPLLKLPTIDYWEHSVFHIFPILTPRRDDLRRYLSDHGVQTDIHYPIPPHLQECYKEWSALSLPITERIHREELSIPIRPSLTTEELEHITGLLNDFS